MNSVGEIPTNEELQGVKDVIASLLIGLKNYDLYPENHSICQKSVANATTRLDEFLKNQGPLRLDIEKDRLLYKNETVFQETTSTEKLATLLFRDGIRYLQFLDGFNLLELQIFLKILKKYKSWLEDADGDLVTAFWEADLSNFRYEAADVYWESEPLIDYSLLNAGYTENHATPAAEEQPENSLAVAMDDATNTMWKLTGEEVKKLRQMILEEEKRDNLNDLLFVVFAIFKDQDKNKDFRIALEFLETELKEALSNGDFPFALRLINGLLSMRHSAKKHDMWAVKDLDHFFLKISSPEVLTVVPEEFQSLDKLDEQTMKLFCQFFAMLHPNAVLVLGPLLAKTKTINIQQQVHQIILSLAAKDIIPLEELLESKDQIIVQKLIPVLKQLEGERPVWLLIKLLRHSSDGVRKQAVKHLVTLSSEVIRKLFGLIEDPNESIRNLVLSRLGEIRSEVTEDLVLNYFEKRYFAITNHKHLLACYRALGQCGSHRSIPFLRDVLFNRAWIPDFRSTHRRGAVVALSALGTDESREMLQKASRSFFPTVRFAYRKALELSQ